jgi:transposase
MIPGTEPRRILLYGTPVDMRKSFDGLLAIVGSLGEDPLTGTLYAFVNRRGNYLKSVYWDRTGYCLFAKRLEQGRFRFPGGEGKHEVSEAMFRLLLDGIVLESRRRMS